MAQRSIAIPMPSRMRFHPCCKRPRGLPECGKISDLLRRVAAHGEGAFQEVRARIRASSVVQADETGRLRLDTGQRGLPY